MPTRDLTSILLTTGLMDEKHFIVSNYVSAGEWRRHSWRSDHTPSWSDRRREAVMVVIIFRTLTALPKHGVQHAFKIL
jgi:hypothetical protein